MAEGADRKKTVFLRLSYFINKFLEIVAFIFDGTPPISSH